MINPKELRIGNLVYAEQFELMIPAIIESGKEIDKSSKYYPIPLTEEWLIKFGFDDDDSDWLFDIDDRTSLHINLKKSRYLIESYDGIIKIPSEIKHVHMLQNLYFALTGEELTLK